MSMPIIMKVAKLSLSKLKNIVGNKRPLFHMVPNEQAESLLRNRRVFSAPEVAARLGSVSEQGYTYGSRALMNASDYFPMRTANDRMRTGILNQYVFNPSKKHYDWDVSSAKDYLMRLALPGDTGRYYRQRQHPHAFMQAAGTIFVSEGIPLSRNTKTSYGDIGIMAGTRNLRYPVIGDGREIGNVKRIIPKPVFSKGVPLEYELPQMAGTLIYNPQYVSREVAKQFKDKGGIPLNARFYRKLKALNKISPALDLPHSETGNISYNDMKKIYGGKMDNARNLADKAVERYISMGYPQ